MTTIRPLGFDLEWPVTFRGRGAAIAHRIALVQVSDASMILMIQVSAMSRMFRYQVSCPLAYKIPIGFPPLLKVCIRIVILSQ
jgi:hypothetical protein